MMGPVVITAVAIIINVAAIIIASSAIKRQDWPGPAKGGSRPVHETLEIL